MMITREHGSWAVLGVPLVVAGFLGGEWFPRLVVFAVSSVAAFLAYVPAQILLRRSAGTGAGERQLAARWTVIYLLAGVAAALPLVFGGRPFLVLFGACGALLFLLAQLLNRRGFRAIPGDLVAVAGLTLTGPAGLYVTTGSLGREVWLLWILCAGFFAGTILHVHMRIAARAEAARPLTLVRRLRLGRWNLVAQGFTAGSAGLLSAAALIPPATIGAYLPMALQVVAGIIRLNRTVQFKRLGLGLLVQSLLFGTILTVVLQ